MCEVVAYFLVRRKNSLTVSSCFRCYLSVFHLLSLLIYTREACCELYATEAHPNTVLLTFVQSVRT